jgi:hypothetical protein
MPSVAFLGFERMVSTEDIRRKTPEKYLEIVQASKAPRGLKSLLLRHLRALTCSWSS